MSFAFEITPEDVSNVISGMYQERVPLEVCDEILDTVLDSCSVEKAALMGADMDDQVSYAYEEIRSQLKVNKETVEKVIAKK